MPIRENLNTVHLRYQHLLLLKRLDALLLLFVSLTDLLSSAQNFVVILQFSSTRAEATWYSTQPGLVGLKLDSRLLRLNRKHYNPNPAKINCVVIDFDQS